MPEHSRAGKLVVHSIRPAVFACLAVSWWIVSASGARGQSIGPPMSYDWILPALSSLEPGAGVEPIRFDALEPDGFREIGNAVWAEEGNSQSLVRYAASLSETEQDVRPPILRRLSGRSSRPRRRSWVSPRRSSNPWIRRSVIPAKAACFPASTSSRATSCRSKTAGDSVFRPGIATTTGHPPVDDYPYVEGHWWDPYNQNVLKGDYPIIGQHTFLNITLSTEALLEARQVPTPATGFESTANPFQTNLIGNGNQFFYTQFFRLGVDLSHGDAAFKPTDWRIHLQPVFNVDYLTVSELGVVSPDVNDGLSRGRDYLPVQMVPGRQARRHEPLLDFPIRAGRFAAVCERFSRVHLQQYRPRGPPLRDAVCQPRPVQRPVLQSARKGHRQRLEHVPGSRSVRVDHELLPAGLPRAGLHGASQFSLRPRQGDRPFRR